MTKNDVQYCIEPNTWEQPKNVNSVPQNLKLIFFYPDFYNVPTADLSHLPQLRGIVLRNNLVPSSLIINSPDFGKDFTANNKFYSGFDIHVMYSGNFDSITSLTFLKRPHERVNGCDKLSNLRNLTAMEQLPDQVFRDLLPFITNLKLGGLEMTVRSGIIVDAVLTEGKCFFQNLGQKIPQIVIKSGATDENIGFILKQFEIKKVVFERLVEMSFEDCLFEEVEIRCPFGSEFLNRLFAAPRFGKLSGLVKFTDRKLVVTQCPKQQIEGLEKLTHTELEARCTLTQQVKSQLQSHPLEKINLADERLAALETLIITIQNQLNESNKQISELRNQIVTLQNQNTAQQSQLAAQQTQIVAQQNEIVNIRRKQGQTETETEEHSDNS